jgi:starch phosphorylase
MNTPSVPLRRSLPEALEPLVELALNLCWTWTHTTDRHALDAEVWRLTRNPWLILHTVPQERLEELSRSRRYTGELRRLLSAYRDDLQRQGWFGQTHPAHLLNPVAYFSMEFGVGEALPLYAGGLGILAGDHVKTASDLDVPLVGVGLLYQEGYFRQILDGHGWQVEAYPYNEPTALPHQPCPGCVRQVAARALGAARSHATPPRVAGPSRARAAVSARQQRSPERPGRSGYY